MTSTQQQATKSEPSGTMQFFCPVPDKMVELANALAPVLEPGDVLFLQGELGAGKTTLTQYLAHALGVGSDQYVSSPSFALLHEYSGRLPVYHMDLYRLGDEEDVEAAGLLDFLESQGVALVEWPDRLDSQAPEERLVVHIDILPDSARLLTLEPRGDTWRQKLCCVAQRLAALENR